MLDKHASKFCEYHDLSDRESEVFTTIAKGTVAAAEIGDLLDISPNTVRIHIKHINAKLGVHSKTETLSLFLSYILRQK